MNLEIVHSTKNWETESYELQSRQTWPKEGKHILAQYDEDTIVVYQAFKPEIAAYAVSAQRFVGCPGYNPNRMTWIKTNFLWMMFRSKWATSPNQERILAIWLKRGAFEVYVQQARTHGRATNYSKEGSATIRLQWDPDHLPNGSKHPSRRAIQLGLKGVQTFASGEDIVSIQDVTEFVREQAFNMGEDGQDLIVARERVYRHLRENPNLALREKDDNSNSCQNITRYDVT